MRSIRVLKGLGLPALTLVLGLVAAPDANATTEPAHQCFQLDPSGDTLRIMRVKSDFTPGMQGLFVRWRSEGYQFLGSGVRTSSIEVPGWADIAFSAVNPASGELVRFGAHIDPATGGGPFAFYSGNTHFEGTLTKIACSTDALTASKDQGEVGHGGPPIFRR